MKLLRRLVTVPLMVLVCGGLLLTAPVLLLAAAVSTVATRSSRALRSVVLVLCYAAVELATLARLLRGRDDWDALLHDVVARAYGLLRAVLDVSLRLEPGSATPSQVAGSTGVTVLARHCGPGDSLFIAWLLSVHYGLRLRVVLKTLLRLEPTLDLAGDRLPWCFVGRSGILARRRIERTARTMTAGDALLLFPEGGNFSWPRWRRALARLADRGAESAVRRLRRRTHTLPPRVGGALAAVRGAPRADVLLLMHTGFAPDGRDRPWWRLPVHGELTVRTVLVPAADVPQDQAALAEWLDTAWSRVDSWVERHAPIAARRAAPAVPSPGPTGRRTR